MPLWRVEPTYNIPLDDWAKWCGVDSSVGRAPRAILAIFFDDRNGTFALPKPSLILFDPHSFTASGVPQVPRQLACVVSSCPEMPRGVNVEVQGLPRETRARMSAQRAQSSQKLEPGEPTCRGHVCTCSGPVCNFTASATAQTSCNTHAQLLWWSWHECPGDGCGEPVTVRTQVLRLLQAVIGSTVTLMIKE